MSGYRRLAIRVIERALRDLDGPSAELRDTARTFLSGHPLLFLWCDLADIRPGRVMARATQCPLPRRGHSQGRGLPQASPGDGPKLVSARASVS